MSEREIVRADFSSALDELRCGGFRVDLIYPADDPHTAFLSRGGERVRLVSHRDAPEPQGAMPPFAPGFVFTIAGADAAAGRAGMVYRDLIPGRLGGRYTASHIVIPRGGPVADWVHYHQVAVQMIYVRHGWVRVAYQGQGEPFVMHPGDLVLQPPGIRHRVLESSDGLEVVEVGAPALHATYADHELQLPTALEPDRLFAGQRFLRHQAGEIPWTPFAGGEAQETGIADATSGLAQVRTLRGSKFSFAPHDGELVFGFVLDGSATLEFDGPQGLAPADAFIIPPHEAWQVSARSPDFRMVHVTTKALD